MAGVNALLLAGSRPGTDPLAAAEGSALKALVPLAGRAMAARVADTLLAVPGLSTLTVLTQDTAALAGVLPEDPRIAFHRSGRGIASSIVAAVEAGAVQWPLFVTTADHPLLTPATVSAFLAAARGADVGVGVVERATVLSRFPGTRRTWLPFRGGAWTGANLFWLGGPAALPVLHAWSAVEQDRKKGWKLVAAFGPALLLRFLTRTITLSDALAQAGGRLGAAVRAVPLSDPLAAVDVDKPADLVLARAVLEGAA